MLNIYNRQPPKTRIGPPNFVDFGNFYNFSDKNVDLVKEFAVWLMFLTVL